MNQEFKNSRKESLCPGKRASCPASLLAAALLLTSCLLLTACGGQHPQTSADADLVDSEPAVSESSESSELSLPVTEEEADDFLPESDFSQEHIRELSSELGSPEEVLGWIEGLTDYAFLQTESMTMVSCEENEQYYKVCWEDAEGKQLFVTYIDEVGGPNYSLIAEDRQGNPVKLIHYYEEDQEGMRLEAEHYTVRFDGNLKQPSSIQVKAGDQTTEASYRLIDGNYQLTFAALYFSDGYYFCYDGEEPICLARREARANAFDASILTDLNGGELHMRACPITLTYTEKDGKRSWYVTTDCYIAFSDLEKAEQYARAHELHVKPWDTDDSVYTVSFDDIKLGLSPEYQDLDRLFANAFDPNDSYTIAVTVGKDLKIMEKEEIEIGIGFY